MEKRDDGYFFTNEEVARALKTAGIIGTTFVIARLIGIVLSPCVVCCK